MNEQEVTRINEAREANVNAGVSAYSGAGATPVSASRGLGVVSSETLAGNTTKVALPPTTNSTTAEGISGIAQVMAEQSKLAQEQALKAQESQGEVTQNKSSLTDLMNKIVGVQTSRPELEEKAGLNTKTQKVTDVTNQIEASTRAQTNELRALEAQGLTPIQKQQQSSAINRRYAFEQADLALIQSAANRDLDTASRIIDRKIQLQLEPLQTQLDFTKFFYQDNKDTFTKAEDKAFNFKINQLNQQYETEKTNRTAIANIQLEALKNGINIPASVMTQLNTAKDAADATGILAAAGISLQNPLDVQSKMADIRYKNAQTAKFYAEINPASNEVRILKRDATGNVIKDAQGNPVAENSPEAQALQVILGSGKFTKDQVRLITSSINNGDDPFAVIKNQAKNIMGESSATKLTGFEVAKDQILNVNTAMAEYYRLGGKTNIFSGNYEKVINKLGEVKDPALVEIAVQISASLQQYRNAVSGTAYSVQEGKDIASIFPGINKSQGLNQSIIDGRIKAFDSTIDSTYKTALGSSYDQMKTAQNAPISNAKGGKKDGDFVESALSKQGLNYQQVLDSTPAGQMPVIDNATGQAGFITPKEFDPKKYTQL